MSQVLELKFDAASGKTITLTVNEPKENLTAAEIEMAMQTILSSDVFHYEGDALIAINQARIVERTVSEFELSPQA